MGHDQIEHARVHRRPDRTAALAPGHGATRRLVDELAQRRHVFDRHDDFDVERFAHTGIDDRDRSRIAVSVAGQEAGDLVERALCRGQTDALRWGARRRPVGPRWNLPKSWRRRVLGAQRVETLEGEREVRAPFGRGERVDLVDDDVLDSAQRLARGRRQHEIERLGRGDENVRRMAQQQPPVACGRVTGAQPHGGHVDR